MAYYHPNMGAVIRKGQCVVWEKEADWEDGRALDLGDIPIQDR